MVKTFIPYKKEEEEEITQFKPYTPEVKIEPEVPTFKQYTPEIEVEQQTQPKQTEQPEQQKQKVIKTGIETPAFTPYFEPYTLQPKQIGDMARIMGTTVEPPKEPVMGLEYIPAKVYSYLVEEPLAHAGALVSQGLASGFRALGLDGLADAQDKVTEVYKAPPVTESVRKHTAYLREQAYQKGQTEGIVFDISESATRLGSLLVQMGTLGKVPSLSGGGVGKRFATLATHGFLTTEGDMKDRLEASVYRAAYSMTPFIAQHWGATGLRSIALDTALNTFLTLPTYVKAYNNAIESGDMSTFISQALPQFVMDIGMALSTKGYPEAQRRESLQNYIRSASNTLGMSYKDLDSVIKSFEKAQEPRTQAQKIALEKQEAKLQDLLKKDDANIEFEKLAADEKNAPINKLLEEGKKNPLAPNIQQRVNEAAMSLPTNSQKARVHQLANNLGLITGKGKEKKVYQKYIEGLTGVKSTKDMNQGQIKMIIDNLENLDPATAKTLSKTKVKELTPELIQWLPAIKEVGLTAKFRNPYEIFNELGLLRKVYLPSEKAEVELTEEKMKFKQELNRVVNQRGITKDSHRKVFEAIENPDALKPSESIKKATSEIPKELEPLAGEARKYKSAEEFVDDFYIYPSYGRYHGEVVIDEEGAKPSENSYFHGTYSGNIPNIVKKGEISPRIGNDQLKEQAVSLSKVKGVSSGYGNIIFEIDKSKISPRDIDISKVVSGKNVPDGYEVRYDKPIPLENVKKVLIQIGTENTLDSIADYDAYTGKPKHTIRDIKNLLEQKGIPTFVISTDKQQLIDIYNQTKPTTEKLVEVKKPKIVLNKAEQNYHDFTKRFFDDWANRLDLPPEKRRDRYVTHIFDKTLTDMAKKGYIDPDILRAFDFGAIPKSIKNPFIQNQRTGQEFGLKKNPMEAMAAYEDYALKTFHYEPLLKKIDTYAKFLPEGSKKYLGNFVGRMTNRPLDIDKGINQDIKNAIDALAKSKAANNPAIKKILPLLQDSTRGNIAGAAAYYYTGFMYEAFLGYRPDSAIRNLGQGFLTIGESGFSNYAKGLSFMATKEFKDAAKKSTVVRSRQYAYMPEQGGLLPSKVRATAMYMFRTADKFNVLSAFATGYQEAKSLGLPDHIAVERGDEVARKTQFMYTKMATPEVQTSAVGKTLGAFTSWPRNWAELIRHWGKGDVSEVYLNYEKQSGKKVYRDNWLSRHQSALRYAVIYALLMYAQSETDIKATQYGGFGTFTSLPRIMSGQLASLKLPVSLMEVVGGTLGQDERMVASGLRGLNPDQYFLAYKRVKEINEGKKDWLDFYFYRDNNKKKIRLK
jgi:hypothetical protein